MTSTSTATCTVVATPTSFSSPFNFSARHSLQSVTPAVKSSRYGLAPPDNANQTTKSKEGIMKRLSTFSTSSSSRQSSINHASTDPDGSSIAFSNTGSTTPIVGGQHHALPPLAPPLPAPVPPNKLVKRSASLRGPSSDMSTSKIPKPVLRRPATSHQRSATLQEHHTRHINSAHEAFGGPSSFDDVQWRTYFTPKILLDDIVPLTRRNSTSIPNPIKRIYPDRRYRPVLVSASEPVSRSTLEFDQLPDRFLSSPPPSTLVNDSLVSIPPTLAARDSDQVFLTAPDSKHLDRLPRRSFSIGDWLPGEGQTWRRPLSRASIAKYRRRGHVSPTPSSNTTDKLSISTEDSETSTNQYGMANTDAPSNRLYGSSDMLTPHFLDPAASSNVTLADHTNQPGYPSNTSRLHYQPPTLDSPVTLTVPSFSRRSSPAPELLSELASAPANSSNGVYGTESDYAGFDADHTVLVRSSPGRRGPAIESIFQDSPPPTPRGRHTLLRDILQPGALSDYGRGVRPRHSIIHEEELSTPGGSHRRQSAFSSPLSDMPDSSSTDVLSSSPPEMPSLLELRHKQHFSYANDDQESSWSFEGDDDDGDGAEQGDDQTPRGHSSRLAPFPHFVSPPTERSSSVSSTPRHGGPKPADKDARSNIFDWSEQQPFDRSPGDHALPRPKTVHGKKDAENRGSRPVGRRAPSGAHVRSQSVPVVQEADGKRGQVVTNKFGTWGVGSKGVTEDWNEDFDFGDIQTAVPAMTLGEEKRLDSGVGMLVPRAIREQQTNVLANIGLLRDWGLLIEEIKELKMRALTLDLFRGTSDPTWSEVDAMIDLADQESDEHTLAPRYTPPSSPSFNFDAFDEPLVMTSTNRHTLTASPEPEVCVVESIPEFSPLAEHEIHVTPATPRRPRKDSEAVARSVIEALQQKGLTPDPGPVLSGSSEKVHFDTATLRRIIPYVQDLRDRVKGILREAEGLYSSPPPKVSFDDNPTFSRMFRGSPASPATLRKTRKSTTTPDKRGSDDDFQSPNDDLAARLGLMTVVR